MNKLFIIMISALFCFWFSKTVVNATPPSNPFELNVWCESKQDLNNIQITVYFTYGTSYIYNDREKVFYITIHEDGHSMPSTHYHSDEEIFNSFLNREKIKCENECIVDIYGQEDYMNSQDAYLYLNKYYSHKRQYVLSKEMFTKNEGKLSVDFGGLYRIYSNNEIMSNGSWFCEIDYRIENGYIYFSNQEKEVTGTTSNCSIQ